MSWGVVNLSKCMDEVFLIQLNNYTCFFCFLKIGLTQRDFTQGLSVSLAFCNGRRLQLPGLCVNHLKCSLEFNDNFWLYGNLSYYKVWWPLLAKNVNNPFPDIVKTSSCLWDLHGIVRRCPKTTPSPTLVICSTF